MGKIMSMIEKYTSNLEEVVEERTQHLVEEKKKTDQLLCRLLPACVFNNNLLLTYLLPKIIKLMPSAATYMI